jgi:hypothetical protein
MLAGMFLLHDKGDVTARPVAHPLGKILVGTGWALAYARRRRVSCRCGLFATPLPMTPLLLPPPLLPACAGPITLACLSAPPTPSRLPAIATAIACLRMGRTERPFTTFEKATPLATRMTCLLPCPTKMMQ